MPRQSTCDSTITPKTSAFRWLAILFISILGSAVVRYSVFEYRARSSAYSSVQSKECLKRPIHIDVYMESKCKDSRKFLIEQLIPFYRKYKSRVVIKIIPYGRANRTLADGKWNFACQHGPMECSGNMIFSCSISTNVIDKYLPFIGCSMDKLMPISDYAKCAEKYGINLKELNDCSESSKSSDLHYRNAIETERYLPIPFIPHLVLNGKSDPMLSRSVVTNVTTIFSKMINGACYHSNSEGELLI